MNSESINELAAALAKAQGKMKAAEMDKTNPHFKSKYASLASLQAATRPALSENGLSIVQVPQQAETGLMLETWLMHSSGQFIKSEWPIPAAGIQQLGSYLTYVKRYAWSSICGIAGDDDDDGNGAATNGKRTTETKPDYNAAPKPPAAANDKPKLNNPTTLLEYVNAAVEVKYNAVPHLFNALKNELGDDYQWPGPDDKDGWKTAYGVAKMHAEAKALARGGDGPDLDEVFTR